MRAFRVCMAGHRCLVHVEEGPDGGRVRRRGFFRTPGSVRRMGFFTTRWVRVRTADEAADEAARIIHRDLKTMVENPRERPYALFIDEVSEDESGYEQFGKGGGFTWYDEEGQYANLPRYLKAQLDKIEPSVDRDLRYYPCAVTLADGGRLDRVYLVTEEAYIYGWGVSHEVDEGKHSITVEQIVAVSESPTRLPARLANELYVAGESGMGYAIFTVVFSDGSDKAYLTGDAVDFITYPSSKGPADVVRVVPHVGRDRELGKEPPYFWCVYSE